MDKHTYLNILKEMISKSVQNENLGRTLYLKKTTSLSTIQSTT